MESKGEEHPELAPDVDGQPKWKMELSAVAPNIGIPQSQIMDTGMYDTLWAGQLLCTLR